MADLTITAGSVAMVSGTTEVMTAGATITAGQAIYKDASDSNKAKLADANDTAAKAAAYGIALNGASSGQPVSVLRTGVVNMGATLTVGEIYVVSDTAGGVAPEADLVNTNNFVTILGVGLTAANLDLKINASGVQVP